MKSSFQFSILWSTRRFPDSLASAVIINLSLRLYSMSSVVLCLCHVHSTTIMDCLSLSRTHFQGCALLGNLHSVDITRRIGSLICSRLTLNVIYTGQLVLWTFIVRETFMTIIIQSNRTKSSLLKVPYAKNCAKKKKKKVHGMLLLEKANQWHCFFSFCTLYKKYTTCVWWGVFYTNQN